ncbi:Target of rapamycin complex 1 subunit mip1 [Hypsizygus marmoreus]|uniref:Target of rapamycin complex 1 subunit mip1 n=1 Tax=Hypsizygus marmoreus TaxID=39966 RepID=A0A369K720_HYPMA|nr:Target of rapamycin complex 1 subunit mip1 [Hypsizygus marmoreus]
MFAEQSQPPSRSGPRFSTGGGSWGKSRSRHGHSSGSDTDREYSTSRSGPSSKARNSRGRSSPEGHINGSIETLPDPSPSIPYWSAKRHLTCGNPTPGPPWSSKPIPWRGSPPGRIKTAYAALVLCLNIDVDPPDVIKTNPCAVLECWVDPHTMPSHKALEAIGSNLHHQFEGLSAKVSYKPILDPSHDDLKRFCQTSRRQAKDDAVLFYYNGHGVPKPTASGELWCFNRDYTQYIPVSLQELQNWLGSPCVYIWDCSAAGNLLMNFNIFAERRDHEVNMMHGGYADGAQPLMNSIQLAACAANEQLPSCPELPADVFTSCLTSPIDIALRHFIMNHQLPNNVTTDMVLQLPGDLKDRRTPLGELNWIFTAITDTIAWTTFSREIFTRLYRCDLLIASLFRNFLLAERIMKDYHCTPHTYPSLPPTNTHPLWATWDLAVDTCLRQLPDLVSKGPEVSAAAGAPLTIAKAGRIGQSRQERATSTAPKPGETPYAYVRNRFFADQLTAFEVWISRGGSALTKRGPMSLPPAGERNGVPPETINYSGVPDHLVPRKPPDQLPIVLQVLLSQPHRLRALILLSQFVDLGPWAVHLVLTIGIFPYISKLLQAPSLDLRPVLIFIWARILAVDSTVQVDLLNTQGYKYFASVLGAKNDDVLPNSSEHKAMCSFILAAISRDHPLGQQACWSERVFDSCCDRLEEPDFLLRQWTALCIAQMWDANDEIKVYGVDRGTQDDVDRGTQDKLIRMLSDDATEVRAAALYALGTFMGASGSEDPEKQGGGGTGTMYQLEERVHFRMEVAVATGATLAIKDDASPMCRKELLVVISCLVKEWRGYFIVCAWLYWEEDRKWRATTSGHPHSHLHDEDVTNQAIAEWLDEFGDDDMLREENRVLLSSFFTIFVVLLDLSVDAYQEVATNAQTIVDYIMALLLESPFTRLEGTSLNAPPTFPSDRKHSPQMGGSRTRVTSLQPSPSLPPPSLMSSRPIMTRNDTISTISSGVSNTIRRTSSFANALKTLANGIAFPSAEDGRASPSHSGSSNPSRSECPDISRPPSPNLNFAQYTSPYSRPPTPQGATSSRHTPSPRMHIHELEPHRPPMDFLPCDVMEALMEEDMERLRSRRRAASHPRRHHHTQHYGSIPSPNGSTFSIDSTSSSVILGLGTGAGIRDVLPLKSSYFDWCCEYFKEPQMRQAEPDEPGSIQYNYQVWRQQRNEHILVQTTEQASVAEGKSWDRPVATLQVAGHPLTMAFHSFDQQIVVANESDMISVWDWSQRKRLNYFCNGNPKGTSITSLHIINEDVGGIIVAGSAEGIIRLYRNYDPTLDQGPVQMVSTFRGLNELVQLRQGSGVVTDWKQSAGILLVGGDSRVIKVWDAQTETQGMDLDTNSDSPVTAIVSEPGASQTFLASFADGVVKVFDRRLDDEDAIVRTYSEHTSWVQNARWHPSFSKQWMSASLDGQVKLWDLRGSDNAIETLDILPKGLSAFDVHSTSGVFAATSAINPTYWRSQRTIVHSLTEHATLSAFSVSTGLSVPPSRALPSPFIPRSSSLVFHPTEMLYGLGEPDGSVRIMGCKLA